MTNEEHNRYIAYTFFANAGFYLLILLFVIAMFWAMLNNGPGPPREFFGVMMAFMTVFYSLFMVPSIIAGYALLKKKSWARIASIIAGVIAGMNFPIGTGACAYALWFFFSDNWKEIYEEDSYSSRYQPRQLPYGVETQRAAYEAEANRERDFQYREPPDWR
ncbi:MAG TPA: hypothetical protein VEV84_09700 [Pyrinomonadaceae bacterium]|nr:hypothetical protein [Pyrinomonadaceae bacterium]